jgi:hypothetical protein
MASKDRDADTRARTDADRERTAIRGERVRERNSETANWDCQLRGGRRTALDGGGGTRRTTMGGKSDEGGDDSPEESREERKNGMEKGEGGVVACWLV